jgi:hypothetical protein
VIPGENLVDLTQRVEDEDVPGCRVDPPPGRDGVEDQAEDGCGGESAVDEGDAALSGQDKIVERGAVRALPAARANITAAVIAVQVIPSREWCGWKPAASTTMDRTSG